MSSKLFRLKTMKKTITATGFILWSTTNLIGRFLWQWAIIVKLAMVLCANIWSIWWDTCSVYIWRYLLREAWGTSPLGEFNSQSYRQWRLPDTSHLCSSISVACGGSHGIFVMIVDMRYRWNKPDQSLMTRVHHQRNWKAGLKLSGAGFGQRRRPRTGGLTGTASALWSSIAVAIYIITKVNYTRTAIWRSPRSLLLVSNDT